jgi:hypothetical protein
MKIGKIYFRSLHFISIHFHINFQHMEFISHILEIFTFMEKNCFSGKLPQDIFQFQATFFFQSSLIVTDLLKGKWCDNHYHYYIILNRVESCSSIQTNLMFFRCWFHLHKIHDGLATSPPPFPSRLCHSCRISLNFPEVHRANYRSSLPYWVNQQLRFTF